MLEVLRRRDDGYHEISTVLQTIDLADRISLEDADGLELRTDTPEVPADGRNLAMRAARAVLEAGRLDRGVRIRLFKRIPVAAGLGGGSADAAAVLLGLNRLWNLRWPRRRLEELAETLGMDVPFFLRGGGALGTGRGERLTPIVVQPLALVLVNPRTPLSTAETYARLTPEAFTRGEHARAMVVSARSRNPARVAGGLYNGLEAAAAASCPQLGRMKAALLAAGALGAAMSGSGPTVFGVARSFEHARQIRSRLARVSWGCWAVRTMRGPAVRMKAVGRA